MNNQSVNEILNGIQAIIFDMDELMVDSHPVHKVVMDKILKKYDHSFAELTREEELGLFGLSILDGFRFFHKKFGLKDKVSAKDLNEQFNHMLLPTYRKKIQAMPGLQNLVDSCKKRGYRLALASSATRAKIDIVLNKFGLNDLFEVVVSGEDEIKHGKPAPDIFLTAAKKLAIIPSQCLVLEDAKNGIEAAKRAGMLCIGVHNQYNYEKLGIKQDLSAADLQVSGLDELQNILFTTTSR